MLKVKGCAFSMVFTAILRGLSFLVKNFIQLIAWILVFFGLWIPAAYALFGLILFLALDFQPFSYDSYSLLYLAGGVLCLVAALIISIRHLITQPLKKLFSSAQRKDEPKSDNDEETPTAPKYDSRKEKKRTDSHQRKRVYSTPKDPDIKPAWKFLPPDDEPVPVYTPDERPSVYFSAVEPDTLIHEYHDRFEVFHVNHGKTELMKIEYKYEKE